MARKLKCQFQILNMILLAVTACASEIHVQPAGPIRTLADAQREARKDHATVIVHSGAYYLTEPLVFSGEDQTYDSYNYQKTAHRNGICRSDSAVDIWKKGKPQVDDDNEN